MDIGRALTFFTEDERWIEKTAIGTGVLLLSFLLSFILVGVVGFVIVMGYSVRLLQNVRDGVNPVLPEWDQWGADLGRGFKLFVVQFIWALPIILIVVPIVIVSALVGGSGNSDAAAGFAALLGLCATCISFLVAIFYVLIQPAITIFFAENEEISDGLQIARIWDWTRSHIGEVVIVTIVYVVGSMIIGTVGSIAGVILCGIGLIVTLPLAQLVIYYLQFHLYGQLAPALARGSRSMDVADAAGDDFTPPQIIS
ncbi:MAG: DUF4013 domain-containing protein [Chloroflexi bacterium]|nr:MAG: DUF4013 domain-containing protein [Chloroflexota bacterium]